jgi:tetratricopeptide (TPR) repeat protein
MKQQLIRLMKSKEFDKALSLLNSELRLHRDCPHLWTIRGDLIQVLDREDGPPLNEAKLSYLKALELSPNYLEALEGIAHYYDAVEPDLRKAKKYARKYVAISAKRLGQVRAILDQ